MRIVQAAAAVVLREDGRLLLVRRGRGPQIGRWSVPGGKVEAGESVEQAAVRETFEETGLRVRAEHELGVVLVPAGADLAYEVHDMAATCLGGTLRAGDDAADARWVAPEELPGLETTDGLLEHLVRFGVLQDRPARRRDTVRGSALTSGGTDPSGVADLPRGGATRPGTVR